MFRIRPIFNLEGEMCFRVLKKKTISDPAFGQNALKIRHVAQIFPQNSMFAPFCVHFCTKKLYSKQMFAFFAEKTTFALET